MDTIERKILLEQFKTRYSSHIPSYSGNTYHDGTGDNRGMMPMDFTVGSGAPEYDLISTVPHYTEGGDRILRYWDAKNAFVLVSTLASQCSYRRLCKRKGGIMWTEVDVNFYDGETTPELKVVSEIPSTADTSYTIGDIVCLVDDTDFCDRFNGWFRREGDTHRYELDYLIFFVGMHEGLYTGFTMPFIECDISLQSKYEDIGIYTSESEHWIPKKKYYLGDLVIYEDCLYKLTFVDGLVSETGDMFFRGYYNEDTMLVEFDDPDNPHWTLVSVTETTESAATCYKESRLSLLTPYKRSYDDDANLLPFMLDSAHTVTLLQNFEPKNIEVEEDLGIYADFLMSVRTYDSGMGLLDNITYSGATGKTISVSSLDTATTYIGFSYITHGRIDTDSAGTNTVTSVDMTSGVRYDETYKASFEKMDATIDGTAMTLTYLETGDMLLNSVEGEMKPWAEARFNPVTLSAATQYRIFKDDRLHGVHGVDEKSDDLHVTRGTSAAMERHSILMEVSSFDDLQNYRNNYFGL